MSPRYLLDTDICIYIRQKRPPQVLSRFQTLEAGDVALSIISYGELIFGAIKSGDPRALLDLERMITVAPVVQLPDDAPKIYGEVRAALEKQGKLIGSNDLWIAAHALASKLTVVTNNEREFRRVHGLAVENWTK